MYIKICTYKNINSKKSLLLIKFLTFFSSDDNIIKILLWSLFLKKFLLIIDKFINIYLFIYLSIY